jgi:hypothetical protein
MLSASGYRAITQKQLRNLQHRLEELEDGRLTVARLRQGIGQMCGMCQMLMVGISSADDRLELRERIKREMQSLKGEVGDAAAA